LPRDSEKRWCNVYAASTELFSSKLISSTLGEAHLRRILRCYARYYDEIRTPAAMPAVMTAPRTTPTKPTIA